MEKGRQTGSCGSYEPTINIDWVEVCDSIVEENLRANIDALPKFRWKKTENRFLSTWGMAVTETGEW
jgi:hypothetical protein